MRCFSGLLWPSFRVVGLCELNCWAVPLAAVGRGGGQSGAAHPSDSCGVNFVSQLEIVSEVPGEFVQFSPDERLHTHYRGYALRHRWREGNERHIEQRHQKDTGWECACGMTMNDADTTLSWATECAVCFHEKVCCGTLQEEYSLYTSRRVQWVASDWTWKTQVIRKKIWMAVRSCGSCREQFSWSQLPQFPMTRLCFMNFFIDHLGSDHFSSCQRCCCHPFQVKDHSCELHHDVEEDHWEEEDGYGNGISWECQHHEEAVSAQNYGPIFVACTLSARSEVYSHPLAEQAQARGRHTKAEGPEGPPVVTTGGYSVKKTFSHVILALGSMLICSVLFAFFGEVLLQFRSAFPCTREF